MTPTVEEYTKENGWFVQTVPESGRRRLRSWTALCSFSCTRRGEYDEEVDVRALSPAAAKRIVADALAQDWEPGLAVRRLVFRPEGAMFL